MRSEEPKTLAQIIADRESEICVIVVRHREVGKQVYYGLADLNSKFSKVRGKKQKRDELNDRMRESRLLAEADIKAIVAKYQPIIAAHPEEIARREESRRKTLEMKASGVVAVSWNGPLNSEPTR
jgi:glycerol-3-phosphate dehydrogenase